MFSSCYKRHKRSCVARAAASGSLHNFSRPLCVVFSVLVVAGPATAGEPRSQTIRLDTALAMARRSAQSVAASSEVSSALGNRQAAETIRYNPIVGVSAGPRFGGTQTTDVEVSLSQTVELGGKRRKRTRAAEARVRIAKALAARTSQQIGWSVRRSFAEAQLARLKIASSKESVAVAEGLVGLTRDRLDAGNGTQLEVNQALAEVARARAAVFSAEQLYSELCFALSSAVGVDGALKLEPEGSFVRLPNVALTDRDIEGRVAVARPEFASFQAEREAAEAEQKLQRSLRIPDVAVGATWTHEDSGVDIVTVGLSIELPLWNRNQGRRAAAESALVKTAARSRYRSEGIVRSAHVAHERYRRARLSVDAFDSGARGNLRENLKLTRDSFEAGKISIVELTSLRKSFVDVELAFIAALAEELSAYFDLQLALGADPVLR